VRPNLQVVYSTSNFQLSKLNIEKYGYKCRLSRKTTVGLVTQIYRLLGTAGACHMGPLSS
jgi:hypothetical protein